MAEVWAEHFSDADVADWNAERCRSGWRVSRHENRL
jgi:hypothetical protein